MNSDKQRRNSKKDGSGGKDTALITIPAITDGEHYYSMILSYPCELPGSNSVNFSLHLKKTYVSHCYKLKKCESISFFYRRYL
jgi:hypothetical protein